MNTLELAIKSLCNTPAKNRARVAVMSAGEFGGHAKAAEEKREKSHCRNGHLKTEETIVIRIREGKKYYRCRICERNYSQRVRDERKRKKELV